MSANFDILDGFVAALDQPVVGFDLPGLGGSDDVRSMRRMPALARLLAQLLDALDMTDEVDVMGIGWDGLLAQQFAFSQRPRLRRLVLVSIASGPVIFPGRLASLWRLAQPAGLTRVAPDAPSARALFGGRHDDECRTISEAFSRARAPTRRGYAAQLYALAGFTSLGWLHRLTVPSLVLTGDDDPIVPDGQCPHSRAAPATGAPGDRARWRSLVHNVPGRLRGYLTGSGMLVLPLQRRRRSVSCNDCSRDLFPGRLNRLFVQERAGCFQHNNAGQASTRVFVNTDPGKTVDKRSNGRKSLPPAMSVLRRNTRLHVEYVDVDGIRLRVGVRRGRGRPMLFFSGLGAGLDSILPLVKALDDVEVITFDVPGSGESPPLRLPRRFSSLARLATRLLDRLGYDEAVNVGGVAWGGALAQQFALDFPERTNRLLLAATSTGMLALPARSNVFKRLATARRCRRNKRRAQASELYGGLIRRRPELVDRHGTYAAGPSTHGYINQLLASVGWTSIHRLYRLRCPTLVMGGDDDPVMPLVNVRLLYWLIPKSYLHIVRGGGHLFLLMRANESAAVIKHFIHERRYDGTDDQDYFAMRNLPADGRLTPLNAAPAADEHPVAAGPRPLPVGD